MEFKKMHTVYFSPTGTTRSVLRIMTGFMEMETVEHDLTDYASPGTATEFGPDDFVFFGFPVYGGRVPQLFRDRLAGVKGRFTFAVLTATYGNREYEDALFEMKNIANKNGFRVIGAAAVAAEHSVIQSVAAGRPDAQDTVFIEEFCAKLKKKTAAVTPEEAPEELWVPGKEPCRMEGKLPLAPSASAACTACGLCAKKCPAGAISLDDPGRTDKEKCIGCMRCVRICPQKARHIPKIILAAGNILLSKAKRIRKEPEMYL